jgi:dihydrofolate synthase/folylpolyglutamate synthase
MKKMNLALPSEHYASPIGREILARMMRLHPKSIDLSLGRLMGLLEKLGHPQKRLPPVFHIAGTNGKGSTIAFMRAGLEAAGYRVHVQTSPHLVRFNERIRLAGKLIDDSELERVLAIAEEINDGDEITFFEIVTAAAFIAFADNPADILLLETGLGGRYDATNVIDRPALTAITPVSYDHQKFLGDRLSDIAREKAGILKTGVDVVLGPQMREGLATIEAHASAIGAPVVRDWQIGASDDGLVYRDADSEYHLSMPGLRGDHQHQNAGLAVACLRRLPGFEIGEKAISQAISGVDWPARMQPLQSGALATLLPAGAELWLDGGHNPAAGEAIAATLAQWRRLEGSDARPLCLIFGMLNSKDPQGFLRPFQALSPRIDTVSVPGEPAAFSAKEAQQSARQAGFHARTADSVEQALQRIAVAYAGAPVPPRVLICGTLYLAGHVLALDGTLPQ